MHFTNHVFRYRSYIFIPSLPATVVFSTICRSDRRTSSESANGRPSGTAELLQACTILNTASYCAETTRALESRLQSIIIPSLSSRVTLESEVELFTTVINAAILSMLKELELACEPAFGVVLRGPWRGDGSSAAASGGGNGAGSGGEQTVVSKESGYVQDLCRAITGTKEILEGELEQRKYFRSWCDKAVG